MTKLNHTARITLNGAEYRAIFYGEGYGDLRALYRTIKPTGRSAQGHTIRTYEKRIDTTCKEAHRILAALTN
jgi:hypothetical protein